MGDTFLDLSDSEFMNKAASVEREFTDTEDNQQEEIEPEQEQQSEEIETEELEPEPEESNEPEDSEPPTGEPDEPEGGGLDKLLQPFKANGQEIQVKNADEALSLMQMGANYTKKMQQLQPNLSILKTLEKNDLLDVDKLNYLIDINKKDPKAIAHLLKDSEIDPMDLDISDSEETSYTPNNHQVAPEIVRLEQVLDSIESTPTYEKCIDVVGNQWDDSSKDALAKEPNRIAELNQHMQLGIYDTIQQEVDRARMFGGLVDVDDYSAYRQIGAMLMREGKLKPEQPKPIAKTQVEQQDGARTLQRKAASIPKGNKQPKPKKQINYLNLSDEEFEKINHLDL